MNRSVGICGSVPARETTWQNDYGVKRGVRHTEKPFYPKDRSSLWHLLMGFSHMNVCHKISGRMGLRNMISGRMKTMKVSVRSGRQTQSRGWPDDQGLNQHLTLHQCCLTLTTLKYFYINHGDQRCCFQFENTMNVFSYFFLIHSNTYMFIFSWRLYTSESDVYRRQILTYKDGPRAERLMLGRRRRWPDIKPALGDCVVFAVCCLRRLHILCTIVTITRVCSKVSKGTT